MDLLGTLIAGIAVSLVVGGVPIAILLAVSRWRFRRHIASVTRPQPPRGPPLAGTTVPLPAALEPHRSRLEALLAPIARLAPLEAPPDEASRRGAGHPGAAPAQLGGAPHLPPDFAWPGRPDRPLSFVVEVDLAALHERVPEAAAGLPADGLLLLFCDVDPLPWGLDPADRERFALLYVAAGAPPRAAPAGAKTFPARRMTPQLVLTLRTDGDVPGLGRRARPTEETLAFHHLAAELSGDPDHRIGGFPDWLQEDGREEAALAAAGFAVETPQQLEDARRRGGDVRPGDWRLLLQVDTDPAAGFEWWDSGRLYVLARDEDVRARRFDRAWLVVQCF